MSTGAAHGLLLAAGAGRRMGRPKALVDDWLVRSLAVLADGGCDGVTVVLGAEAEAARARVPRDSGVRVVVADDWATGMGASLAAGLAALAALPDDVAAGLVHLVDLPDVGPDVVRRLLAAPVGPAHLARASYGGEAGHPVLLGRDHWDGVAAGASGDRGAREYLRAHPPVLVECGDLAGGADVDSMDGRDSRDRAESPDQPSANLPGPRLA